MGYKAESVPSFLPSILCAVVFRGLIVNSICPGLMCTPAQVVSGRRVYIHTYFTGGPPRGDRVTDNKRQCSFYGLFGYF